MSLTDRTLKKRRTTCNGSSNSVLHIESGKELKYKTTISSMLDSDFDSDDETNIKASSKKIILSSKWLLHDKNNIGAISIKNALSKDMDHDNISTSNVKNQVIRNNDDKLFKIKQEFGNRHIAFRNQIFENNLVNKCMKQNKCDENMNDEKILDDSLSTTLESNEIKTDDDEDNSNVIKKLDIVDGYEPSRIKVNNRIDITNDKIKSINDENCSNTSSFTNIINKFGYHNNDNTDGVTYYEVRGMDDDTSSKIQSNDNNAIEDPNDKRSSKVAISANENNGVKVIDDEEEDRMIMNKISNDTSIIWSLHQHQNHHLHHQVYENDYNIENNHQDIKQSELEALLGLEKLQQQQYESGQSKRLDNVYAGVDGASQPSQESSFFCHYNNENKRSFHNRNVMELFALQSDKQKNNDEFNHCAPLEGNYHMNSNKLHKLLHNGQEKLVINYDYNTNTTSKVDNMIDLHSNNEKDKIEIDNSIHFLNLSENEHLMLLSSFSTSTSSAANQSSSLKHSNDKNRKKEECSTSTGDGTNNKQFNTVNGKIKQKPIKQKKKKQEEKQQQQKFKESMRNLLFVSSDNANASDTRILRTGREIEFIHRAFLVGQQHQHNNVNLSEKNITNNDDNNDNVSTISFNDKMKEDNDDNVILPHWFETKLDSIILNSMKQIKRKSITAHTIAMQKYLDL